MSGDGKWTASTFHILCHLGEKTTERVFCHERWGTLYQTVSELTNHHMMTYCPAVRNSSTISSTCRAPPSSGCRSPIALCFVVRTASSRYDCFFCSSFYAIIYCDLENQSRWQHFLWVTMTKWYRRFFVLVLVPFFLAHTGETRWADEDTDDACI